MKDKDRADGWITVDRRIHDHWIYSELPYDRLHAWLDLILSANFRDKTIMVNGEPLLIRRGSFLTSTRKLAERWGWGKDKVSRFLSVLRDNGMVKTETHGGTLLTVVNYDFYQSKRDRKSDTHQTRNRHAPDTDPIQEKERRKKEKERERKEQDSDDDGMTPDELARFMEERNKHGTV